MGSVEGGGEGREEEGGVCWRGYRGRGFGGGVSRTASGVGGGEPSGTARGGGQVCGEGEVESVALWWRRGVVAGKWMEATGGNLKMVVAEGGSFRARRGRGRHLVPVVAEGGGGNKGASWKGAGYSAR